MKIILLICILCLSQTAFSQRCLISDIDDTIKKTHALTKGSKKYGSLIWNFLANKAYTGMPELFAGIEADFPEMEFAYVTASNKLLKSIQKKLLKKFPGGEYYGRRSGEDKEAFKVAAITDFIAQKNCREVIFLGDNVELDPVVYEQFHSTVDATTFIHKIYETRGGEILEGQQSFLTAADLSLKMFTLNLASLASLEKVIERVEEKVRRGKTSRIIPKWFECSSFDSSVFDLVTPNLELNQKILTIKDYVANRCQAYL